MRRKLSGLGRRHDEGGREQYQLDHADR